jgi:hypothetical protein
VLRIPFSSTQSADQSLKVLIPERQVIGLRLVWNNRASGWDVEVSSDSGSLGFLRLVPSWPLLREHRALSPIEGDIIALPLSSGSGAPLTEYSALGESWGLFWLSPEDVATWERGNDLG